MNTTTALARYRPENLLWAVAPLRAYFQPRFFGLDHIDPGHPTLFLGNRGPWAVDYPLLAAEVFHTKRIVLHPLGTRSHFRVPLWNRMLTRLGVVDGTPGNCEFLMEQGRYLVAFTGRDHNRTDPGTTDGAEPLWQPDVGFAAMAVRHRYRIIPFVSRGADQAYQTMLDGRDIMRSPVGRALRATRLAKVVRPEDWFPPIMRGIGPTLIPRPQRLYFAFGDPVETAPYLGKENSPSGLTALRREVEGSLLKQLKLLLFVMERDKEPSLWRRVLCRL